MRITALLCKQHLGRGFKVKWLLQSRRSIPSTGAEAFLAAKGIETVDPRDILSPPFHRDTRHFIFEEPEGNQKQLDCRYVFNARFSPPAGIEQMQILTNCVVRPTLPDLVQNLVKDNTAEEDEKVKNAILHSHLLDSHQEKLPRLLDVINRPGMIDATDYSLPVRRKNKTLTYQLVLLLDQLFPEAVFRHIMENVETQVTLEHSAQLFTVQNQAACVLSSSTPLPLPMGKNEVSALEGEDLPDIYPLSPFLNCHKSSKYSEEDYCGVVTNRLYPHTIFIHLNMPRMKDTQQCFYGKTLLKAFAHTAAYAKQWCKLENGDLETPLAVQIVHTNGQMYHIGVFQLNTLNLTGSKRNIFWHHPWEALYENCSFIAAKPVLKGYNPRVFSLLKALHVQ